jgi:succinate-semialdehyde dehydrogenase/glutarate-semialdehyde dehydrogenase
MLGNSVILKHAPNVSKCSILIENLFKEADFPSNLFSNLLISSENVPAIVSKIIPDKRISGVTLTGSAIAGSFVASLAGKYLKKSVLELGGSDAYVILKDADLNLAVPQCVTSRMNNTGQTCIAAKRFIVDETIADEFIELYIDESKKYIPGDPLNEYVNMGPMARRDLQLNVHNQVLLSIKEGAKLELGGQIPERKGFFYPPTVLTNIKSDSLVFNEEIFGPVASIITFNNENEAIQLANSTDFGLGAAIFTQDIEKGNLIAKEKLEAGSCFVNEFVKSDPRLPFGGIKSSGFGRELSELGIREFANIKTVVVK